MSANGSAIPACHHYRGVQPLALICLHTGFKLEALKILEAPELYLRRSVVWARLLPVLCPQAFSSQSVLPGLCQGRGPLLCPQDRCHPLLEV